MKYNVYILYNSPVKLYDSMSFDFQLSLFLPFHLPVASLFHILTPPKYLENI